MQEATGMSAGSDLVAVWEVKLPEIVKLWEVKLPEMLQMRHF